MIKKALITSGIIITIISFTGCLSANNVKAVGTMKEIETLDLFSDTYISYNSQMTVDLEKELNEVYEKKEAEKKEETTKKEESSTGTSEISQKEMDNILDILYENKYGDSEGTGHLEGNPLPEGATPDNGYVPAAGDTGFGSSGSEGLEGIRVQ